MVNKTSQPDLKTKRLILRKFRPEDAIAFSQLLRDREVAATTLMLPYPCDCECARKLIQMYLDAQNKGLARRWAICSMSVSEMVGGIRLELHKEFNSAEIGFWIGKEYWGNSYAYEAASAVIDFAFNELSLNRLEAHSMTENNASIQLLKKLGFRQEGVHPDLVVKWGEYKDVITFGYLKRHHQARNKQA